VATKTRAEFSTLIASDFDLFGRLIREAGIGDAEK
jgi:hypothetical protein